MWRAAADTGGALARSDGAKAARRAGRHARERIVRAGKRIIGRRRWRRRHIRRWRAGCVERASRCADRPSSVRHATVRAPCECIAWAHCDVARADCRKEGVREPAASVARGGAVDIKRDAVPVGFHRPFGGARVESRIRTDGATLHVAMQAGTVGDTCAVGGHVAVLEASQHRPPGRRRRGGIGRRGRRWRRRGWRWCWRRRRRWSDEGWGG